MTPTPRHRFPAARLAAVATAAAVAAFAVVAHAPSASACGNAVNPVVNARIREVASAGDALGEGKPRDAALAALRAYPGLHVNEGLLGQGPRWDAQGVRAQRIVAVAIVRTDGLLTAGKDFHATTADERRESLTWAIGILRAVANLTGAPDAKTDLGEALSKLPETRAEARTLLENLAAEDLVTSPEGYATLAELREASGDLAGRDAARRRASG